MKNLFLMVFVISLFCTCKEGEVGEVNYNTYNYHGVDVGGRADALPVEVVYDVTGIDVTVLDVTSEVSATETVAEMVEVQADVSVPKGIIATKTLKLSLSMYGDNVVVEGDESELAIFKKMHFWTEPARYENAYYLVVSVGPSKVSNGRREFPIPDDPYYSFFNLYSDDTEEAVLLVNEATETPALSGKGVKYYCEKNGCCLSLDLYEFFWNF
jgi:hypothetical protein